MTNEEMLEDLNKTLSFTVESSQGYYTFTYNHPKDSFSVLERSFAGALTRFYQMCYMRNLVMQGPVRKHEWIVELLQEYIKTMNYADFLYVKGCLDFKKVKKDEC